jgi:electron transfer flavoprotein alpha subunit
VISVRTAAFSAVSEGGSSPIVTVDAAEDPDVSQFKGTEMAQPDRPEQTSARIIISGGRSLGSAKNFTTYMGPAQEEFPMTR